MYQRNKLTLPVRSKELWPMNSSSWYIASQSDSEDLPSGYISTVLSVFAHTLRTVLTLSVTADSGSPLTHSSSSRLTVLVGQLAFTLTNNLSTVREGEVETQI